MGVVLERVLELTKLALANCKLSILAIDESEFGRNILVRAKCRESHLLLLDRVSQASELTPPSSQTNLGIRLDRFYLFFYLSYSHYQPSTGTDEKIGFRMVSAGFDLFGMIKSGISLCQRTCQLFCM